MVISASAPLRSAEVAIAAASNLVFVIEDLASAHRDVAPETELRISTAASGNLTAQIAQGAPFDIFISADLEYPRALIAQNHAVESTLFVFARGVLCLWPAHTGTERGVQVLSLPSVRRIAIPNPDTTPYGRAVQQLLIQREIWTAVRAKSVFGENVAQTYHFIDSGNADIGFVSVSLLHASQPSRVAEAWVVPASEVDLPHGAVLLRRSESHAAARAFLLWLGSNQAQEILHQHGYLPGKPGRP